METTSRAAIGLKISALTPKPMTLTPVISPRMSGNHLVIIATGQI